MLYIEERYMALHDVESCDVYKLHPDRLQKIEKDMPDEDTLYVFEEEFEE
jgi:ArsR family transcriptional regulator